MKEPLFKAGDIVRVKSLHELKRDFGEEIKTPCHFVRRMYEFCDQIMEVEHVYRFNDDLLYYSLKNAKGWYFDECVLDYHWADEPQVDVNSISINYESLS